MADAESLKQLAADLYAKADTVAKSYDTDYAALAAQNKATSAVAEQEYKTTLENLKAANTEAYKSIGADALLQSRRSLYTAPEAYTKNGAGIYGTAAEDGSAQILHDNALGNAYNDITAARESQADTLTLATKLAVLAREKSDAESLAALTQQQIAAQTAENQAAASDSLKAAQYLTTATDAVNTQTISQNELEELKKQNAYQNALDEVNTFGKVMTQAAADALGVSIGTSAAYAKVAQIAAAQAAAKSSGGYSRTSGGTSGANYAEAFLQSVLEDGKNVEAAYNEVYARAKANGATSAEIYALNKTRQEYASATLESNAKTAAGNAAVINSFSNKQSTTTANTTANAYEDIYKAAQEQGVYEDIYKSKQKVYAYEDIYKGK